MINKGHLLVIHNALVEQNGLLHFDGTPFSGVAIFTEQGKVVKRHFVEKGVIGDVYLSPFYKSTIINQHLITDELVAEHIEPLMVEEDVFTGTLYSPHNNGWVESENVYREGILREGISYHMNTPLYHEVAIDTDNTSQTYEFCENGHTVYWDVAPFDHELEQETGRITCQSDDNKNLTVTLSRSFLDIVTYQEQVVFPSVQYLSLDNGIKFFDINIDTLYLTQIPDQCIEFVHDLLTNQHIKYVHIDGFCDAWLETLKVAYARGLKKLDVRFDCKMDSSTLLAFRDAYLPDLEVIQ
ncbi:hypothetical protein [Pseudoalteromonas obscura]|uniref:Uncharacterized protein n=1 Tax=Pseudoalteromonas obscura TaxID=3048491 RepID=A0ABT7EGQ9_9GAMM|nr:hypothetical protein [Pseudoalteromonas sp. P94(2023)]MDK2594237.1 hypothetical protein [Pseudoalteromonas sp. P94(2023)]